MMKNGSGQPAKADGVKADGEKDEAKPEGAGDLDALKRQMADMQAKLDALSRK
jgi:hypothetical protein